MSKTIMVVDDSGSFRTVVKLALQKAGYAVVEAVDGMDASEKIGNVKPNLIVCDVNMPRMDGITLIKALRGLPEYKKVPIMMLTTESSQSLKQQGREAGATGWMVKPFDPDKLLEMLRRAFAQTSA